MPRSVHQAIERVFTEHLALEVPAADTDLFEAGMVDSLALVQLILALEQTFKVTIPLREIELERLRSVNAIAELLGELVSRNSDSLHMSRSAAPVWQGATSEPSGTM